ncbi:MULTISPECIES: type II toxin-antitoxin system HipA family toxin [Sulfitobacter]|uniref:Type II toxin-antitoxin system HipA family toxin n=1 Tax=Sulfitobacter faviae TaxID=1775881 RepID=A0AAX3LT95_9RHOB|nr:type II toxin-antitoxin system HipA family toxin [Sulfitobacter faviae]WCE71911.1 type II toxin-antitoxin system HipA family toxin [Sulfitobacter faviae]
MADVSVLNVELYGEAIGTLTRVPGDRSLFAFNEDYIESADRPTLGLFFKDEFGDLRTEFKPVQKQVMPFFSNLLPEGHLRKYLAEQAGVNAEREFFLLWALGRDLPGAITIKPADGEIWPPEAAHVTGKDGLNPKDNMLRFSLAGVQLKFSAIEAASGGLTIPASGTGGNWIVKLPSRDYLGVPENEFSMMRLASMLGIDVPRINLVDIESIANLPVDTDRFGTKAFVIERFDRRSSGDRAHIEDFAQVFGVYSEDKYKKASMRNIATVIGAEGSDEDIREFLRRLTFNTLIGNGDMHLKNWSLIYPDRRTAALSPAYDFVSTIPYITGDSFALNYSRVRDFAAFDEDEISHLAAKAALPRKMVLDVARETASDFASLWKREKDALPMLEDVRAAIDALLPTLPLMKEHL